MQIDESVLDALLSAGFTIELRRETDGHYVAELDKPGILPETISSRLLGELLGELVHRAAGPRHAAPGPDPADARLAALEHTVAGIGHRMNYLFDRMMPAAAPVPVDAGIVSGPIYHPLGRDGGRPAPRGPVNAVPVSGGDCPGYEPMMPETGSCARCGGNVREHPASAAALRSGGPIGIIDRSPEPAWFAPVRTLERTDQVADDAADDSWLHS